MSLQELLEEGPPCAARVVDAALRLSMTGATWGLIAGSHDSLKEGYKGFSRALYVAKSAGSRSLIFGCCGGTYFGVYCGCERLRRKRDWANATVAGAFTGALMAAKSGSGSKIFATSAAISALATAVNYLSPLHNLPTGL